MSHIDNLYDGIEKHHETTGSSFNKILDNDGDYCDISLLKHISDNNALKKLSIQLAIQAHLPVNTVFMMGLSIFSSVAVRKYKILYPDGHPMPIGMYIIAQQPSGTGKSRCLRVFQAPFVAIQKEALKKANLNVAANTDATNIEKVEELESERDRHKDGIFITNATPEGLETTLSRTNGFFSAVSSEQGLFDSLLGGYKASGASNNNDVILGGFDGEALRSVRVTRNGYSGQVVGAVVCFAQQGSILSVLSASNGTGLSERFILMAERHRLGTRDHLERPGNDKDTVNNYSLLCNKLASAIQEKLPFDEIESLTISEHGFKMIDSYRNELEPFLADGAKFSHASLRGAVSKINIQIMKMAANLHLIEDTTGSTIIKDSCVKSSIELADELLRSNVMICRDLGIIGLKAEFVSILSLFESNPRARSERNIISAKRETMPFKTMTKKSAVIRDTLNEMIEQSLLHRVSVDGSAMYTAM